MDLPQPPQDQELHNIIDKLAQFVARNGPEFEQMTKNKQKDNPKFSFLFCGEHFNYYQYKVTTEQAILKQKALRQKLPPNRVSTPPGMMPPGAMVGIPGPPQQAAPQQPWMNLQGPPPPPTISIETLLLQQSRLQEQIQQSEQNLAAQQQVMSQQQAAQAEEALRQAQADKVLRMAQEAGGIDISELDHVLQPIIDSCTKDAISHGKGWILAKSAITARANQVVALHLLSKSTEAGAPFTQKLHIIYLVNDVLHHCVRKNADELRKALESVVVPMFCNASLGISDEQKSKLNKLLNLWESKNNYFALSVIEQLKQPQQSWAEHRAAQVAEHAVNIAPVTAAVQQAYEAYRSQHQAFVQHASQQIQVIEQQKLQIEQQQQAAAVAAAVAIKPEPSLVPPMLQGQPPPLGQLPPGMAPRDSLNFSQPPPGYMMPGAMGGPMGSPMPNSMPPGVMPGVVSPHLKLPDLSKPPPGFAPQIEFEIKPDELLPSVPYFELPAGLVVPLIKLEDCEYKPLDPDNIRLPPPAPPSERLLAAVEAFYGPPSHERPRDSEGWEKLGLYEYYRAKNGARKKKEEDIQDGCRSRSRSPSPIVRARSRSKSPPKRRYRSVSRSPSPIESINNSPAGKRSPGNHEQASPSSKNRSPERSPTPPSFLGSTYGGPKNDQTLDESNKGHQMLRKMGWGGAGLGAKEQGIEQPISGGEVRDRTDQYKGIGMNLNDPYENFRKTKAQSFINRMKARAEET